ncbi:hypothetical protein [Tissierella sp.]|uniref:hypothetical protein n=1 Tax=Tissierella sp. TaxID=41274 RepID=UPI002864245A|nr:hypothetical protein [Tissierella sp.]MDR7857596.1 hypothetical protein [Tissierella sp.]
MATTLSYTRKFIILKKDFATITGSNPKGHGKLEIRGLRGILTVSVENAGIEDCYNVGFITKDKSNSILELGKIFTDDIGKGRGEFVFIQRDLESKGFSMEKIVGILVMKDKDILLGGYIDKENGVIERYMESLNTEISQVPILEQAYDPMYDIPALEPVANGESIPVEYSIPYEEVSTETLEETIEIVAQEPIVEEIEEIIVENIVEEIREDIAVEEAIVEEIVEEITAQEYTPEQLYEGNEIDPLDFEEESMEPDYKTLDYMRKLNQKNQTTSYVLSILRFFPYIDPFNHNLKGYNWWIVELDKENEYRSFLPYFSYISGGNNKALYMDNVVTCNQLVNKYQHYLFGLYNEGEMVKYFVYGVPGKFSSDEHPYSGASGFNTWYPGVNTEGYWIIYIDPITGKPVDNPIPMIPMD